MAASRSCRAVLVAALLMVGASAGADEPAPGADDVAKQYADLDKKLHAAYEAKDYTAVAAAAREQIALVPAAAAPPYNLACALARLGQSEEALASLRHAVDLGYDEAEHLRTDSDLASLHAEKPFAEIAAKAEENERRVTTYSKPRDVPGVNTLEGEPAGGLRWRLRLSKEASKTQRQRLLVWLHPSGGSMNEVAEALAPQFAAKGWALLVATQKRWDAWRDAEAKRLLDVTLPDVAKVEGVDATRPVLLGYSAGGQAALMMWAKEPGRFGGLILDAAYPFDPEAYYGRGEAKAMEPPKGDAARGTPILAYVGSKDPNLVIWEWVKGPWTEAGVPWRVEVVEGLGHTWMLGRTQMDTLLAWLGEVAAGKRPAAPAPAAK